MSVRIIFWETLLKHCDSTLSAIGKEDELVDRWVATIQKEADSEKTPEEVLESGEVPMGCWEAGLALGKTVIQIQKTPVPMGKRDEYYATTLGSSTK